MKQLLKTITFLCYLSCSSQVEDAGKKAILIEFDSFKYTSIAKFAISELYNDQLQLYNNNPLAKNRADFICTNYNLADLELKVIPKFRLNSKTSTDYNCNSNILEFVEFREFNKYMDVLVYNSKVELITIIRVPDLDQELSRINPLGTLFDYDSTDYNNYLSSQFIISENASTVKQVSQIVTNAKSSFFFQIFGINELLIEVDPRGYAFVHRLGTGFNKDGRVSIENYFCNRVSVDMLRELSKGNFQVLSELQVITPCNKNCPDTIVINLDRK